MIWQLFSITTPHLRDMESKWSNGFRCWTGWISMTFLLWLSGIILCVISIDYHITVTHNKYRERFAKSLLTIILICVTVSSFLWSTLDTMFKGRLETIKLAKLYMALSAGLSTGTISNLALLDYGELKRQNSSRKQ